jgi:hypothetical protein
MMILTRRIKHPFDETIRHARSAAMIAGVDRFAKPLQSELDIVRLQMAPASTSVGYRSFGKRSKYSAASCLAAVRSLVNFSRMKGLAALRTTSFPQHQPPQAVRRASAWRRGARRAGRIASRGAGAYRHSAVMTIPMDGQCVESQSRDAA